MRSKIFAAIVFLFAGCAISIAKASPPSDFQTTQVVSFGLQGPSGFDIAPDGRIFILERTGKVLIHKNNQLLAIPFTELPSAATGDRGLTGIAFDPDFEENHFVYFYYTGQDLVNRLVRMDASNDVGTNSTLIYETESPSFELHVGGTIAFGPDGKLYISIGDNGISTNAQDLSNPHGKILRINKDGSIPSDNPFYDQSGLRKEIWAYGFRNPFRFQFDSETGELFVGDVGDASWEEVNKVEKGKNYGWPLCEGHCVNPQFENPIYAYEHNNQSSAVVIGPVYRGNMFPEEYVGDIFIGDYARGFIKTLEAHHGVYHTHDFDPVAGSVVDMKVAPDGSIYYITYIPGRLYRLTSLGESSIPVANSSADVTGGNEPLEVQFSSEGSYDPDGDELQYLWDFGDGTTSSEPNPTKVYNEKGSYIVELQLSDGVNFSNATPIVIQVGIPPEINIASPTQGGTYRAGDTIFYTASAIDSAGFDLHDADFTTEIIFHHDDHIHPFIGPLAGNKTGQFTIPRSGEPDVVQSYEIKITVEDSNGLTTSKSVFIYPEVVTLTLETSPNNYEILLNGVPHQSPYTFPSVIGYEHIISAPVIQSVGDINYQLASWSNSDRAQNIIQTPDTNSTYTAFFEETVEYEGSYYSNTNLDGEPVVTRADQDINFNWGEGSPDPLLTNDNFSVRWRKVQHFAGGRYIFSTMTDDGARLYINGNLIIDEWHTQSPTRHNKIVNLPSGDYEIVMEYLEVGGGAVAELDIELAIDQSISSPSFTYYSEFWNFSSSENPVIPSRPADFSRSDTEVNFNWQSGSPNLAINNDYFVGRFKGSKTFSDGNYKFTVTADDGFRLYVDGELILDKWFDQPPSTYSVYKNLSFGNHEILIEYYEKTGGAVIEFSYGQVFDEEPPSEEQGLKAEYFDNGDFSGPSISRIDPQVNFNWGADSPDESISSDDFSVRWSGVINVPTSGEYTFYTVADDGVRLYINDQLLIDEWHDSAPTEHTSEPVNLEAGNYKIVMEYYENRGGSMAQLLWSSESFSKQIIDSDYLIPSEQESLPSNNFIGKYWAFTDSPVIGSEAPLLQTESDRVYFNWGESSPSTEIPVDKFIAKWEKDESFEGGEYEFKVTADDGVRVYIDNEIILNQWNDQPPTTFVFTREIASGNHKITVEYYERSGGAVMELDYNRL